MSNHTNLLQTWLLPGVTVLLAIFTGVLAYFTYRMAKSTENALKQNAQLVAETHELVESNKTLVESEERHHQENLRPLCYIKPTSLRMGHICDDIFGDLEPYLNASVGPVLSINGTLENVGLGPAKNVSVILRRFPEKDEFRCNYGPIDAHGSFFVTSKYGYSVPLPLLGNTSNLRATDVVRSSSLVIYVEFEDFFGKIFHTTHRKYRDHFYDGFSTGKVPDISETIFLQYGMSSESSIAL
ncbi:hypothetical protein [Acidithiobacillus albertensis]|uniref:hypothetical protein n=1 Tax=Acidithiobacillus albertensis TaxID=119978 RepID=UPI00094B54A2|nr:hypothetical protein [Acidithiobacillus albertensis]